MHPFFSLVRGGVCYWVELAPHHPPPHTSKAVSHVSVEQALENKNPDALKGVEDGECVGKVDIVDSKVEQPKNPGGPKEENEQGDPLDIGDQQLDVPGACVELVEDHGVDGVDQEAKIGADDYGSRNNEG